MSIDLDDEERELLEDLAECDGLASAEHARKILEADDAR